MNPPGEADRAMTAAVRWRIRALLKSNSPDLCFAYLRRCWELFQSFIADKTLVHAAQGLHQPLPNAAQLGHDWWKPFQRTAAIYFGSIVRHGLDAK